MATVVEHLAELTARAAVAAERKEAVLRRVNEARDWSGSTMDRLRQAQRDAEAARVLLDASYALLDVGVDPTTATAAHVTELLPSITVDEDGWVNNAWAYLGSYVTDRAESFGFTVDLSDRTHAADHGFVVPVTGLLSPERTDEDPGHSTLVCDTMRAGHRMPVGATTSTHGGDHHEDLFETSFAEWVVVLASAGEPLRSGGHVLRSAHTVSGCDHCGVRSSHPLERAATARRW